MSGYAVLYDARQNRGRRFAQSERTALGLTGLLPPAAPRTLQQEDHRLLSALRASQTALSRYELLMQVLDSDETLFFAATQSNLPRVLPMIYAPAVGDACQHYSDLNIPPRGMWLDIDHVGRVRDVLRNWPEDEVQVVVSDCKRILRLGDLGANGMGIPVGKYSSRDRAAAQRQE